MFHPRFPLYIPSKGRSDIATTPRFLDKIGVAYRLVIEEQQYDDYNKHFHADKLIVLDKTYQQEYDSLDEHGLSFSKGSGPARNFIWDHSINEGHSHHWIMDDNIRYFAMFQDNQRIEVADGTLFHAMETFCLRYKNVAMAGPQYFMFCPSRQKMPPFATGTRIYSCNLIRNDVPFRWRGRYNEDTILSLDMLKAGWNTVQFNAFLQLKMTTQTMAGGNTEAFYSAKGTLPKAQMLVEAHPDVAKVVWRFNRWHHHVDYSPFKKYGLTANDDFVLSQKPNYKFRLEKRNSKPHGDNRL